MSKPGPAPTVTDDRLVQVVRNSELPVTTYGTVADQVEIGDERVRQRLNQLAEAGIVERGELNGGSLIVYWYED